MHRIDGRWIYSATDLNNYLECRRLPELELLVALGRMKRPDVEDEQADLIRKKGELHEAAYLDLLRRRYGDAVVEIGRPEFTTDAYRRAEQETLDAMRNGAPVIYQAKFFDGTFIGHADFLQRVDVPSDLGAYSYEAIDTKLALSTKPYFIVQLCNYSEHLERLQGCMPKHGSIVFGDGKTQSFQLSQYLAYYRYVKSRFLAFISSGESIGAAEPDTYPIECGHCMICAWNETCEQKRIDDDHLSLVARMRRDQTMKLERSGIPTVATLASPDAACPRNMPAESFTKLRDQAGLQVESRSKGVPIYKLLAHDIRLGFGHLPEHVPGDVYFDMEGDPMYEPGRGLEYLFGCWLPDDERKFLAFWGCNRRDEKVAFEQFVDFIVERRKQYPGLHVYHYANYEKAALSRLSQQHSTRIDEIDELLRSEVFVDLFAVVRQAMMIGEDSYSIKRLERFYGMVRATEVKKGDQSIVEFEKWRVTGDASILQKIADYNEDDCRSTWLLHEWLLKLREEWIATFGDVPWRPLKLPDEPCHAEVFEGCKSCVNREKERRAEERRTDAERKLLAGIEEPQTDDAFYAMPHSIRSRYLLGNMLSYHQREDKPAWWEFFDRCKHLDTLQDLDKDALGGLTYDEGAAVYKKKAGDKNSVYTYRFPEQSHKMDVGKKPMDPSTGKSAGEIVRLDDKERIVAIKRAEAGARELQALIPGGPPPTGVQQAALTTIAQAYLDGSLDRSFPATAQLLESRKPRAIVPYDHILQPADVKAESVSAVVRALDSSYLFIQGPPGSGKSTVGSEVICDLLNAGKRVAVMSGSHKAIHNLLAKVEKCMAKREKSFRGLYKHSDGESEYLSPLDASFIRSKNDNKAFDEEEYDLAGGTSWLFARAELVGRFDYIFIDEAGQVALANALAVSLCAKNVVLLGDPSQLAQVSKGSHALHADDSVLQHLLGREVTVPPNRGIFLDHSYRMHPAICSFVSDAMYDGRLEPGEGTELQCIAAPRLTGAGLRYIPIEHAGNGSSSAEEAERVVTEILHMRGVAYTQKDGATRALRDDDIIVVTPYNAQRRLIAGKLEAAGIRVPVGTVDKFQGQEAAVVFYSMATSSGEDVPRDASFLFDANRFNVAISRARAMTVLVCSARLLDLQCSNTEEMALVNLLCMYVDRAERLSDAWQGEPV